MTAVARIQALLGGEANTGPLHSERDVMRMVRRGLPTQAITAVFLYSLLPIMRNTYLALTGVEPGIREAARGIGMTFGQRLRMVELPIAVPVILAGVRTAVVMNIGVMTIAATIGAGGLGVLILASISRSDMSMLIVGAVLVSLLAIFADLLLQWLQRSLTPKGLLK